MDELVLRAMARWPNVPAVFGWLRLDRRGQWWLIDRGAPGFDEARDGRGSPITSEPIIDFIGRNYAHDALGRWYWQNGPQRVFVCLDLAPLVLRVFGERPAQRLVAHTGHPIERLDSVGSDDAGNLFAVTDRGPGVIDDRDLAALELDLHEPTTGGALAVGPAGGPGGGSPCGELRLMGRHPVRPLAGDPGAALGFERHPRP